MLLKSAYVKAVSQGEGPWAKKNLKEMLKRSEVERDFVGRYFSSLMFWEK